MQTLKCKPTPNPMVPGRGCRFRMTSSVCETESRGASSWPALRLGQVDADQEQRQLFRRQLLRGALRGGPRARALLQALGAEPPAVAIPEEDLQAVAPGVGEGEEVARERVETERVADEPGEGVEGLAQVCGPDDEIDPCGPKEVQHRGRRLKSSVNRAGSAAGGTPSRQPLGATISGHSEDAILGTSDPGRIRTGTNRGKVEEGPPETLRKYRCTESE